MNTSLMVELSVKWWVDYYLQAVALFCAATGIEPDIEKVTGFIVRFGIRISPCKGDE